MKPNIDRYTMNQPQCFPPIYMVARSAMCGATVLMGQAQFSRNGYQNYCILGDGKKISIPLKDRSRRTLSEIEIEDWSGFVDKIRNKANHIYGKSTYQEALFNYIRSYPVKTCMDMGLHTLKDAFRNMKGFHNGQSKKVHRDMFLRREDPSEWIATVGHDYGAKEYFCGETALDSYLKQGPFDMYNIKITPQKWVCDDDPTMSYLHYLLLEGPKKLRERILDGYTTV